MDLGNKRVVGEVPQLVLCILGGGDTPGSLQPAALRAQLAAAERTVASVKAGMSFHVEQLHLMLLEGQKSERGNLNPHCWISPTAQSFYKGDQRLAGFQLCVGNTEAVAESAPYTTTWVCRSCSPEASAIIARGLCFATSPCEVIVRVCSLLLIAQWTF